MSNILILTPYDETNIKTACNIIGTAIRDFKIQKSFETVAPHISLLSKTKEFELLGFTATYLTVLGDKDSCLGLIGEDNQVVVGTVNKEKKFDVIIGLNSFKEIMTTQESLLKYRGMLTDNLYTSDDVQLWLDDYGQLIKYLRKEDKNEL